MSLVTCSFVSFDCIGLVIEPAPEVVGEPTSWPFTNQNTMPQVMIKLMILSMARIKFSSPLIVISYSLDTMSMHVSTSESRAAQHPNIALANRFVTA